MEKVESYSYSEQLNWLSEQYIKAKRGGMAIQMRLLLSLSESVKKAREAELYQPLETPEEAYQRGLADAITVIENSRIPQQVDTLERKNLKQEIINAIKIFVKSNLPPKRFLHTLRI